MISGVNTLEVVFREKKGCILRSQIAQIAEFNRKESDLDLKCCTQGWSVFLTEFFSQVVMSSGFLFLSHPSGVVEHL